MRGKVYCVGVGGDGGMEGWRGEWVGDMVWYGRMNEKSVV